MVVKLRLVSLLAALSVVFSAILFSPSFVLTANALAGTITSGDEIHSVGDSMTITGTGFTASRAITVKFGTTVATITAGGTTSGTGTVSVTVTVPEMAGDIYTTFVTTSAGDTSSNPNGLTVTPNVVLLDPTDATEATPLTNGPPLTTTVRVKGTGFATAETVAVDFDGTAMLPNVTIAAANKGTWRKTITVPARPAAGYVITGTGTVSGAVPAAFTVDASLTVNPPNGWIGKTGVSLVGRGFQSGETVSFDFDGPALTTAPAAPVASAAGNWSATFTVPAGATPGAHVITATGDAGTVVPFTFNAPDLVITDTNGSTTDPAGTVVTVDGTGFQPNETGIRVKWNASLMTTTPATVTANAAGVWSATFAVPSSAALGAGTVDAYGDLTAAANVPDQTFTVVAGIAINPTSGPVGTVVTVTGSRFVSGDTRVYVTYDGGLPSFNVAASAAVWTKTITIPAGIGGAHTFSATTTGGITVPADQTFTVTPKMTLSPTGGVTGTVITATGTGFQAADDSTIALTWDTVLASTPVTLVTTPAAIPVDGNGGWTASFTVPAGVVGGAYTVSASGAATAGPVDAMFQGVGLTLTASTSGPVGTVVSVSGTGFAASETGIQILWDGLSIKTGVSASAAGAWSSTFTVPAASSGAHLVDASGPTTGAAVVPDQTYTVTSKVLVSSTGGKPGDNATVTGTGFASSETTIQVTWDGVALVAAGNADVKGGWSKEIIIPADFYGVHNVNAYGSVTTAGMAPDVPFSIVHQLLISPESGPVGTVVSVSGTGFYASEAGLQILFNGVAVKTGVAANSKGTWSSTFTVPASGGGSYLIAATGTTTTTSQVPAKSFAVNAKASIDPISGYAGKTVTISGSGFVANSTVTVTFDGTAVATTPSPLVASATGNVSGSFVVPSSAPGGRAVVIKDSAASVTANFNVTSSVTSSVVSGTVGAQTSFGGQGFPPSTAVTFTFDSAPLTTVSAVTTDATGAFNAPLSIPDAARGTHIIKATAGATTLSLNFEVSPSAAPATSSGTVDSSLTVTGKGFGANQALTVTIDGKAATTNPAQATASATGGFSLSVLLPKLAGGTHIIKVADSAANVQFNVSITPKVVVSTGAAKVGDKLATSGTGMPAGATVAVSIDGASATTNPSLVVAAADGTFSADVTVPAGAFGSHTITFSANNQSSQGTYSVTPTVSTSVDNGNVGTSVTISGTGFAANSQVAVTYDGAAIGTTPAPVISNGQGGFQAAVAIPRSPHGQHALAATDAAGHKLEAAFTMESTAPALPTPLSPISGSRQGAFSGAAPTFSWSAVTDPSGVTYTLQVSKDSKFSTTVIQQAGLTATTYTAVAKEKLGSGFYYWRVKATDGASNEGAWSQLFSLKVGILPPWMPLWMLIVLIVVGLAIVAGVLYLLVFSKRTYV